MENRERKSYEYHKSRNINKPSEDEVDYSVYPRNWIYVLQKGKIL